MLRSYSRRLVAAVGAVAISMVIMGAFDTASAQDDKFKVYLSMSWIGNNWQTEAMNMQLALAKSEPYASLIDFEVQASGDNAQKQIQQLNAMIQAGANAIIIYPISPTALNQVIRHACDRGIVVVTYDSFVEEECAHHVGVDAEAAGYDRAKWLFEELGGSGKVVEITGVSGTSYDSRINAGTARALEEYPDIEIIASANGQWSQPEARVQLTKILATRSWDDIDGLLVQTGCYEASMMQMEAGIAAADLKPCGGEASNGHRIMMLPEGTIDGALGLRSFSAGSAVYGGAMALKLAVAALQGKEIAKSTTLSHSPLATEDAMLCVDGTTAELEAGCNAINTALIPDPYWYADIYSPELPQLGVNAAILAMPDS